MEYHHVLLLATHYLHKNLDLGFKNSIKNVFTPGPIVSFRSARGRQLVFKSETLPPPPPPCGKAVCEVWINIEETDTYLSTATGESFKTNHKLNCYDDCLIYLHR